MPLAVSDAAISAASGLLGVIVGAVIGGFVEWKLERRREKAQAKTAARLLRMELSVNAHRLDSAIGELLWWPFYETRMKSWDRFNEVLAATLTGEQWSDVSQSAVELHDLGEKIAKAPGSSPDRPLELTENFGRGLIAIRANAIRAFHQLTHLADDEQELEPTDPPKPGSKPYTPGEASNPP